MAEVSKEQTATQMRAGRPGSGAVPVRKWWRFVCAREHAGEHGKGALSEMGVGTRPKLLLQAACSRGRKKRGCRAHPTSTCRYAVRRLVKESRRRR